MIPRLRLPLIITILAVSLLILSMALAPIVQAQTGVTVTTLDNVRLRSGPGTQHQQLTTIPYNTTVPAYGRTADNLWIQVQYNGIFGWAASQFLRVNGDLNSLPIGGVGTPTGPTPVPPGPGPTVPPPTAPPPSAVTATTTTTVNVRSGPGTSYPTIGKLNPNTTVALNARWGSGSQAWVRFDFSGQPGWLASWLVRINGDINSLVDLSVVPPTPTPLPTGVNLINNSYTDVCYVYAAPAGSGQWGANRLTAQVAKGASVTIPLTAGNWDLYAQNCLTNVLELKYNVTISGVYTWDLKGPEVTMGPPAVFRLVNSTTRYRFCIVNLIPAASADPSWGPNWLGPDQVIEIGQSRDFQITQGTWDFRVLVCNSSLGVDDRLTISVPLFTMTIYD